MALTLSLTPEIEQYLVQKAIEQGISIEDYAIQLLTKAILADQRQRQVMGGETALLSEQSLAQDWGREEEDTAWSYLRGTQQG
jgi:hypothetical protein